MGTGTCPFCGKKVDKFIVFRGDVVGCRYCGIHTKQTNADRIRAMSDQELAEFLDFVRGSKNYPIYYTDWLEWLKQEVKE